MSLTDRRVQMPTEQALFIAGLPLRNNPNVSTPIMISWWSQKSIDELDQCFSHV
jgi:hypothetical protein